MIIGTIHSGFSISPSALNDAALRLANTAHNVANGNTHRFIPDVVHSSANASGGVSTNLYPGDSGLAYYSPSAADLSQTNLTTEAVNTQLAKVAYTANVTAFQTQDEAFQSLLAALG